MTSTRGFAVTATLAAAAVCWVVVVDQMRGMDMGAATELGSLSFFVAVWVAMMAAMMLPGAVPAVSRAVRASGSVLSAPLFAVSYLVVWTLIGLAVFAVYRPHGTDLAGALTIAAGLYELTPLKRSCRLRCQATVRSGLEFGIYCVGSSVGLMAMLVAVGVMSITWTVVIAALVLVQKLLPPRTFVDVPVALAIVGLGLAIVIAPSSVPGFVVPM
jgi:predicted metal-binding membrane protein